MSDEIQRVTLTLTGGVHVTCYASDKVDQLISRWRYPYDDGPTAFEFVDVEGNLWIVPPDEIRFVCRLA